MSPEDASDLFQTVWIEVYSELPKLRQIGSLRAWLLTIASHQAFHWKRRYVRHVDREGTDVDTVGVLASVPPDADMLAEAEREQMLREAVGRLNPRCQQMIRLLFFEQPPMPYAAVANRLGLAVGSIGFIRGRCLQRLRTLLHDAGF